MTSSHTHLTYTLVERGRSVASGTFLWPSSWQPSEQHADALLHELEAGLERGCARAKLPSIGHGVATGASSIDADPKQQVGVSRDLERALAALSVDKNVCTGAR